MLEKNAKVLRNIFLILALLVFLAGVLQVILFAYNISLGLGLTRKFGFSPHSFAEAAIFFVLTSIAFGIIHSSAPKS